MNMNKILAAGLIAAVASTASFAECGNGGFYIGLNAGIDITKTKVNKGKHEYKDGDKYGDYTIGAEADGQKKITAAHANKRSELAANTLKKNNKKTKFLAELVLGYDFRMNDVMMGVDLTFGTNFGKTKLKAKGTFSVDDITAMGKTGATSVVKISGKYATVKEQWHIGLMPRVGYLFTPEFEGYVTFGAKFTRWQLKAPTLMDPGLKVTDAGDVDEPAGSMKKKNSLRISPVLGAGVRYEFMPNMFAKLEYNFEFKSKAKVKGMMPELKKVSTTGHAFKLGIGYRF